MKGSFQAVVLSGQGKAGKAAGKAIGRILVINRGPVDEALIATGNSIRKMGSKHGKGFTFTMMNILSTEQRTGW